jgi:hypothetical protein
VQLLPDDESKFHKRDEVILFVSSKIIADHKLVLESTKLLIQNQIKIVEKLDNNSFAVKGPKEYDLFWNKSDTALLELITALLETRSISNIKGNLSRKEAIEQLSQMFNKEIKDPESKLTRATSRKKDISPYLASLKEAFDNYAIKKEERLDEIKG